MAGAGDHTTSASSSPGSPRFSVTNETRSFSEQNHLLAFPRKAYGAKYKGEAIMDHEAAKNFHSAPNNWTVRYRSYAWDPRGWETKRAGRYSQLHVLRADWGV